MVMEKSYIEDAALKGFEEQPSGVLKQCG